MEYNFSKNKDASLNNVVLLQEMKKDLQIQYRRLDRED